jgi:serine protease SohB
MTEILLEYALFAAKAITVVIAILLVTGGVLMMKVRRRTDLKGNIEVRHLNERFDSMKDKMQTAMLNKRDFKRMLKRRTAKGDHKSRKTAANKLFVINFHGDIRASAVASLREEITAILTIARPEDEVLLRLESSGGLMHAYGLAASQLLRLKDRQIPLTVAVDKIAASGGYMMACVADRIVGAPFAILGSIGVISQLPNFHRWLKENNIDFEQLAAGEYKRTLTLFGENTDSGRAKAREEVEDAHTLFKAFIKSHRSGIEIDRIATGEHWFGERALDLRLVDELRTSDDYLLAASRTRDLYEVSYTRKKGFLARILQPTEQDKGP